MKTILITLMCLISISYGIDQDHKKKEVIPASHEYRLSEKEVKEACVAYVKSKGIKIPEGTINISGLDTIRAMYYTSDKSGKVSYAPGITIYVTEYNSKDE